MQYPDSLPNRSRSGFTLIEISVVLVIIALIIAGILVGVSMIRSSQIRSIITDYDRIATAIGTFRGKYGADPGDMVNATYYWGRADGGTDLSQNCASPDTDISATNPQATCNGNGDGIITSSPLPNTEEYRTWQQLSNAGLLPGAYSGIGGTTISGGWRQAKPGINVPASRIPNTGYTINYTALYTQGGPGLQYTSGPATWRSQEYMYYGLKAGGLTWGVALTPSEAFQIDSKMDDGMPGTGRLLATYANWCSDSANGATAQYVMATTTLACVLMYAFR